MGSKQKRERLQQGLRWRDGRLIAAAEVEVIEGKVILVCRVCKDKIPTSQALEHVKKCWGIAYSSVGLIPLYPPPEAYRYHKDHP